ncbi:MAG TPA: SRPBCC domain-containing protein, partial [Polyangiaceae bacterium]
QWLRPSPDVKLTVLEFDFREGGRYRFAYDTPGNPRMLVGGVYLAIEPPTRLVFSWLIEPPDPHAGIDSRVTVSIAATTGGSELFICHERLDRADANARHAEGWAGALEQLQQLLALVE